MRFELTSSDEKLRNQMNWHSKFIWFPMRVKQEGTKKEFMVILGWVEARVVLHPNKKWEYRIPSTQIYY